MSLPLRYVFYKPKSLPHFGKLMHSNEVVALLGRRELPRRCGWIIYTIQGQYWSCFSTLSGNILDRRAKHVTI